MIDKHKLKMLFWKYAFPEAWNEVQERKKNG